MQVNASSSAHAPGTISRGAQVTDTIPYTIRRGDTLGQIAARFGTDVQTLAAMNGIRNPNLIFPGRTIQVPSAMQSVTVQRGDTMAGIAARAGVSLQTVLQANPQIANPNRIYPGDRIAIPQQAASPAISAARPVARPDTVPPQVPAANDHRLGGLSARYESGNRGPGTISSGRNDPGGVSYGTYQLSSNAGTLQSFLRNEGSRWAGEFGQARPGSNAFNAAWRAIASREPAAFGDAQHAFIERTHYRPAVDGVKARTGIDLDSRHNAVRDAVWSVSVQHAGAQTILTRAVGAADRALDRSHPDYDRTLIEAIYSARTDYVLDVARNNSRLTAGQRQQLRDITTTRYPAELRDALAMLDAASAAPSASGSGGTGPVDGRAEAARHGVEVKNRSVAIGNLDPAMRPVIAAVATAARDLGLPTPVITSGNDSRHGSGSLHCSDRALDFRGNNITNAQGRALETRVREILGPNFDVLFEIYPANPANDHLHVEFDPD